MARKGKRRRSASGKKNAVPESVKLLAEATAEIDRHAGHGRDRTPLPRALRRYEKYSGMGE